MDIRKIYKSKGLGRRKPQRLGLMRAERSLVHWQRWVPRSHESWEEGPSEPQSIYQSDFWD